MQSFAWHVEGGFKFISRYYVFTYSSFESSHIQPRKQRKYLAVYILVNGVRGNRVVKCEHFFVIVTFLCSHKLLNYKLTCNKRYLQKEDTRPVFQEMKPSRHTSAFELRRIVAGRIWWSLKHTERRIVSKKSDRRVVCIQLFFAFLWVEMFLVKCCQNAEFRFSFRYSRLTYFG